MSCVALASRLKASDCKDLTISASMVPTFIFDAPARRPCPVFHADAGTGSSHTEPDFRGVRLRHGQPCEFRQCGESPVKAKIRKQMTKDT